jgi:hypothetical protein
MYEIADVACLGGVIFVFFTNSTATTSQFKGGNYFYAIKICTDSFCFVAIHKEYSLS